MSNLEFLEDIKNTDDHTRLSIDVLPPEIIIKICSYLEASFVIQNVIHVCKKFYLILKDDYVWKNRLIGDWNYYPFIRAPLDIAGNSDNDFKKICVSLEKETNFWNENNKRRVRYNLPHAHIGFIDSIRLTQEGKTCISGGRDGSLQFWNIDKLDDAFTPFRTTDILKHTIIRAHQGWIWSISLSDEILCSAGWDNCINIWDLNRDCKLNSSLKCAGAVLCTDIKENLIAGGTYFQEVVVFDIRQGTSPILRHSLHHRSVLALKMDSNVIITASDDKNLFIYDKRSRKLLKGFKCQNYIMSLSYGNGYLLGGDRKGILSLWSSSANGFSFVDSYDIGHRGGIRALHHNLGCVITGSADNTVSVSTMTPTPMNWACIKNSGEIGDLHYTNRVLAYSYGNDAIAIYKPK